MIRKALSALVILVLMANVSMAPGSNAKEIDHKIAICHVPSNNPDNARAITIDKDAWEDGESRHNTHPLDFVIDSNNPCPPVTQDPEEPDTQIPEFPTIALPAAAVLGLLFLFRRGRGKE